MPLIPSGYVKCVTPGTPVPLYALSSQRFSHLAFSMLTNTGNVYIGTQGMNKTTGAGVGFVLKNSTQPFSIESHSADPANQLYLDADNAGDGVAVFASAW